MVVKAKALFALTEENTLRKMQQRANRRLMILPALRLTFVQIRVLANLGGRPTPSELTVGAALSHALNEILEGRLSDHAVELRMKIFRYADLFDGDVVDLPIIA